ncbi:MAG: type IV pili methyl-accepting chemotaxis transducer N-terminal domain-containing protein, partial [Pseudomonadota bacterium]
MKLPLIAKMRSKVKGGAKTGSIASAGGKGLGLLIALLLTAVVAMGIVYSVVAIQGGYDKEYLGLLGEQRVLSQRISKFASQISRGTPVAFDQLEKYRDEFAHNLRLLRSGNPETGMPRSDNKAVADKLDEVVRQWEHYNENAQTIIDARGVVIALREIVRMINDNSAQLLAQTDEVATLMAQKGADPDQVYYASRQLMLSQRIINNVNRVLEGGEGAVTAADRFGRDASLYGRVVNGFLEGDSNLNIRRITDPQIVENVEEVDDLFGMIGKQVSGILERSPEMFQVSEAVQNVLDDSDTLLQSLSGLEAA